MAVTVSDEREEGQRDGPSPPRINLWAVGMALIFGGVVTTELLWPSSTSAIHDATVVVELIILSARPRRG
jgi:hypothetical protein